MMLVVLIAEMGFIFCRGTKSQGRPWKSEMRLLNPYDIVMIKWKSGRMETNSEDVPHGLGSPSQGYVDAELSLANMWYLGSSSCWGTIWDTLTCDASASTILFRNGIRETSYWMNQILESTNSVTLWYLKSAALGPKSQETLYIPLFIVADWMMLPLRPLAKP